MIRFHLDEHVDHSVARGLRSRGIDVTTATDANLLSADDSAHLAFAWNQKRVIFTHDADYLRLAKGAPHCGIVFCPPARRSIGHMVRFLELMHICMTEGEMEGRIEFM